MVSVPFSFCEEVIQLFIITMKHLTTLLLLMVLSAAAFADEHLSFGDIPLARPYQDVIKALKAKGFYEKSTVEEGSLLLGRFWGFDRVAAVPIRTGDSCFSVMMIVPEPKTDRELFSAYNKVRAKITDVYGIYGKEENIYIDENVTDFSPVETKIAAARYEQAILFTQFKTLGGDIDVSINRHEATGLGVFVIFRDKDYVEPSAGPVLEIEESKAVEPTRLKGVDINRPAADVVGELQAKGLRDEMSLLERRFYQKNHITKLKGEFFGYRDCEFSIQGDPDVDLVNVSFPAMESWSELYGLYTSLRQSLVEKYGSIYRNDDQVAGLTSNLELLTTQRALESIRTGQAHLQTMLLNRYDGHAFKVIISHAKHNDAYRVNLIYYTPQWLSSHLNKSSDL